MIIIRPEAPQDIDAVTDVVTQAFGQSQEATLTKRLRESGDTTLALVAELDGKIVGHILFSPARIDGHDDVVGAALGPLSVHPDYQKTGVGAALTYAGLAALRHAQVPFSMLLGHVDYYPRFGYQPASELGISSIYGDVGPAFMVIVLDAEQMAGVAGLAHFHDAFNNL